MADDIKNWMNLFRWIVKHIRDEYGVDEGLLDRTANLEEDLGIDEETIEEIIGNVARAFGIGLQLQARLGRGHLVRHCLQKILVATGQRGTAGAEANLQQAVT